MPEPIDREGTITRAQLRAAAYECCKHLSRKQVNELVDIFFDEICQSLAGGENVKLHGFGNFAVRAKRERIGRNPKSGQSAKISARRVITFKASNLLVAQVNGTPE